VAKPLQENGGAIPILEVINEARSRGLPFPLVIRFQDLLRHRDESVNRAFENAITEFNYRGEYRGVFPIKVNQLREVIEEIVDAGQAFHFGLEAGSKPELVAALAMHKDAESLVICNGYKDPAFIRIALLGRKLDKQVIIVVEKLEELEQTIRTSKEVGVEPLIGIRVRLTSKGAGKWTTSGGENAKFGLDTFNLIAASDMLKSEGLAHPAIVSEGGRAIVAHHSVLVMEAFSSIEKTAGKTKIGATEKDHKLVGDILEVKQRLKRGNRLESLHDIQQIKEEAQQTFDLGLLDLESKAKIDAVYWQLATQIVGMHRGLRFN